jgi:hypothetical protein
MSPVCLDSIDGWVPAIGVLVMSTARTEPAVSKRCTTANIRT